MKTKGSPAILYINDHKQTVDCIDYEFNSTTIDGVEKEYKKLVKELHKEDNKLWYQGRVSIDGVIYDIDDMEIIKSEETELKL